MKRVTMKKCFLIIIIIITMTLFAACSNSVNTPRVIDTPNLPIATPSSSIAPTATPRPTQSIAPNMSIMPTPPSLDDEVYLLTSPIPPTQTPMVSKIELPLAASFNIYDFFEQDNEIFYASTNPPQDVTYPYYFYQSDGLYRIYDDKAQAVRISGSCLFTNEYVFWENNTGLYRIDNNDIQTKIYNEPTHSITEHNGLLYFCASGNTDTGIFSMNYDGTELTQLFDRDSNSISVTDDFIYFAISKEPDEQPMGDATYPAGILARINLDGSDFVDFGIWIEFVLTYNGKVIYQDWKTCTLYIMDAEPNESIILYDEFHQKIGLYNYIIYNDILFMEEFDRISLITLDGTSIYSVMCYGWNSMWGIFNDYIYLKNWNIILDDVPDYNNVLRVRIDGTDAMLLY
jgi:hypothetical protein